MEGKDRLEGEDLEGKKAEEWLFRGVLVQGTQAPRGATQGGTRGTRGTRAGHQEYQSPRGGAP